MNFSTIKAITIPEGSVKQITDSNGVVLWTKINKMYRQLEYIQNDTTAKDNRIPLGISFASTSSTNLDIWFSLTQTTGQYYGSILSGTPNSHLAYVNGSSSTSQLRVRWRGGTWLNLGTLYTIGTSKHSIGLWNGQFWLDGNSVGTSSTNTSSVSSLTLFSQTPDGSQYNLLGRFYEMILKSDNVETHHYLPVQRKCDGMIGVYDTVTGEFKTTAGNNSLVAGPVTNENPSWSPDDNGSWHTIWEGSLTISNSTSGRSGRVSRFAHTANGSGEDVVIRITFSDLTTLDTTLTEVYYMVNDASTKVRPTSPIIVNTTGTVLGTRGGRNVLLYMFYDSTNDYVYFSLEASIAETEYFNSSSLTVTKIEQYY